MCSTGQFAQTFFGAEKLARNRGHSRNLRGMLFGNHHNVNIRRDPWMPPTCFAHKTLDSIADHRVANLFRDCDPQSSSSTDISTSFSGLCHVNRLSHDNKVTGVNGDTSALNFNEVGSAAQPGSFGKRIGDDVRRRALFARRGDGETFTALGAAPSEHIAATVGSHAGAKSVGSLSTLIVGLIRTLHD